MLVGFSKARIGIMTDGEETFTADNIFELNARNGGRTQTAQIQNLSASSTTVYGSNTPRTIRGKGAGNTTLTLTTELIPADRLAQMTGLKKENGIYSVDSDTVAPYCAVELIANDENDKPVRIALLKGVFTYPEQQLNTNDNSGQKENYPQITFTASARMMDNRVYAKAFEADEDFNINAWNMVVFPMADLTASAAPSVDVTVKKGIFTYTITPPENDGGAEIEYFTVYYGNHDDNNNTQYTAIKTFTPKNVFAWFKNNDDVDVYVTATNNVGESDASEIVTLSPDVNVTTTTTVPVSTITTTLNP
ncbi:phage tail protein [Sporolactobacillus shoreicorticis]|uniref:Phage tail protein n=1 Tax=Sporolactobacillus shoreicorticis TaxID=1923877 RepID=A0ABW5S6K8_9BACL|nr:phage tail protein [Sporolactobacillus shoreicorticis]MCO7126639.1 phage tail protein [Sporolactobacillus shoreicorticis]